MLLNYIFVSVEDNSPGERTRGTERKAVRLHVRWHSYAVSALAVTLRVEPELIHGLIVEF